jgi:superfamily II DNA or RNA helicase
VSADRVQPLFEAVRADCASAVWSRGVELARAQAVSLERDGGDEVALRVTTRGGLICPTVLLELDDPGWECDCGTRESVCEHAVAAVIALRRARAEGRELPGEGATAGAAGRIGYRITRRAGALHFERVVVGPSGEEPLRATLAAVSSGRAEGPAFAASQDDLRVESVLGAQRSGALPRGIWQRLLPALAGCPDVTLDGRPVRASAERAGYVARVADRGDGFLLRVVRDPSIVETLPDELALKDDGTLCLTGEVQLAGREREDYGPGRYFPPDAAAELVSEILPALARRLPVAIETDRLPRATRTPPRIAIEVTREDDTLCVLPTLVYGDPPSARVDGGRLVPLGGPLPLRDEAAERAETLRLQQLGLAPGRRTLLRGEEAVALAERIRGFGVPVRGSGLDAFRREAELHARVSVRGDRLEVGFASGGREGRAAAADPARVLRAWREGESLVPLLGGGFAPLPADWLARYGGALADLLAARDASGRIARAALPDLAALLEAQGAPVPAEALRVRDALARLATPPAAELPADLRASLRGYQRHGVDWLAAAREAGVGALLADDMGLGKTLQALCALRGRALVVAPTSVMGGWQDQIREFRPGLRCAVYHGPDRRLDAAADVTLTTYTILRLDAETLAEPVWDTLILDESQMIKNPDSQAARAAFRLKGDFRVAMTGTPVENRLDELWSQLHFTHPGLLGARADFDERYAKPIAAGDTGAAARLRARIAPCVLRRSKREVAPELPPRTEVVVHAELGAAERDLYAAILAATRREVVEKLAAGAPMFQALEALLRLRQAACHPALVPGQAATTSAKLELLVALLDSAVAEGHKALVFSQWTSLLDRVEPALRDAHIDFTRLDGSTRDRSAVVARFQDDRGPPVMLISLKAGGTGLNLTAADNVFILDPWWNPAVEDQAADRAHRIGQDRPVLVTRLVARDTVEERILALQARKRKLADAALVDAGAAAALSRDELMELLV